MKKPSPELLQAIAVTAELTGTAFSEPAARVMAYDLAQYPEHQVFAALRRCRRELRSTLTLAAILERIEDGRPGPEEAWALVKPAVGDESVTIIWTPEIKAAFFIAADLADDPIAARMAFLEAYRTKLQEARATSAPVTWEACLGYDPAQRESAILQAVECGQITADHAAVMLPHLATPDARVAALVDQTTKLLTRHPGED